MGADREWVLASLLREGLNLLALHRDCLGEEEAWRQRVLHVLEDMRGDRAFFSWRTVGCNCGAVVRELEDGSRVEYYSDAPHRCSRRTVGCNDNGGEKRRRAIDKAVEALLQRAYEEARGGGDRQLMDEHRSLRSG